MLCLLQHSIFEGLKGFKHMCIKSTCEQDARLLMDIFKTLEKQGKVTATNKELAGLSGIPVHRVINAIIFASSMKWLSRTAHYFTKQPGLRRVMQIHWDVYNK